MDPQSNKYRLLSSFTPKIVVYLRPRNEEEENLAFNGVLKKEYTVSLRALYFSETISSSLSLNRMVKVYGWRT